MYICATYRAALLIAAITFSLTQACATSISISGVSRGVSLQSRLSVGFSSEHSLHGETAPPNGVYSDSISDSWSQSDPLTGHSGIAAGSVSLESTIDLLGANEYFSVLSGIHFSANSSFNISASITSDSGSEFVSTAGFVNTALHFWIYESVGFSLTGSVTESSGEVGNIYLRLAKSSSSTEEIVTLGDFYTSEGVIHGPSNGSFSGILEPGLYFLDASMNEGVAAYSTQNPWNFPPSASASGSISFDLKVGSALQSGGNDLVNPVPEAFPAGAMLGLVFAGIVSLRKSCHAVTRPQGDAS